MLELWLMRHGEAEGADAVGADGLRRLTERGRQQVAELGRWLQSRSAPPERVWHSPLVRARETAVTMAEGLQIGDRVQEMSVLSPGMQPEALLQQLATTARTPILCVGHQPDIGRALSVFLGGARLRVDPGFCAALVWDHHIQPGHAQLKWATDIDWFA